MNNDLARKKCLACEDKDLPKLTHDEIMKYFLQIKDWKIMDDFSKIYKEFNFKNFVESLSFVNEIGDIAEKEGHHPDINISYSKVVITLWTHSINSLSENDFILASKIDELPR